MRTFVLAFALMAAPLLAQTGPSILVSPSQLNAELRDPRLVLLHVGPPDDYKAGHIPGARFVDLRDIAADQATSPLSLELPDEQSLRSTLEKLGISDNSRIVVAYGAGWISPGTRVVWTLQTAGLGAQTRWLDGGTAAWKRAGHALTTADPPPATPGRLTLSADRSLIVDHRWMQARAKAASVRLIDARAPLFFDGPTREETGRRIEPGHLPGAKNLPFNTMWGDSGLFPPVEELRKRFAAAGVQPGDTVAAYCHIGQQATVVLFAARLLGHAIRLYDGSMNDWETRKLPLENATATKPPERK
jgi:thiosulfate/3-mercaptopyruvate sulfurtransferase